MDILSTAAAILAALFLLIFLLGILAALFTPVMSLITLLLDLILPPIASLYYKIFKKEDDTGKKQGPKATNYSIKQGEEIK